MDQLAIVIVTYHSAECIAECIDAARRWSSHVIVVDNASTDQTVEIARRHDATVIANPDNRGFAAAANQGFTAATTPHVLLLNPDVTLAEGRDELIAAAKDGAATGMLTDVDGKPQTGFSIRRLPTPAALSFEALGFNRLFPGNPVNRHWRALDLDLSVPRDVHQPPGAFLLVRREAWTSIGAFDESFRPIWFEDVDFCKRLLEAGFQIRYTPAARATHAGAHSIRQMDGGEREVQWYVSLLRYASKHFGRFGHLMVAVSVAISSVPRAGWTLLRFGSWGSVGVCKRVLISSMKSVLQKRFNTVRSRRESLTPSAVQNSTEADKAHLHVQ